MRQNGGSRGNGFIPHGNNAVPERHWANRNGNGVRPEEHQSTLSRYWTAERGGTSSRNGSNYTKIRNRCLEHGLLWEDPDFLPSNKILPKSKRYKISWLRPHELSPHPRFTTENSWRAPLETGILGDGYLLLAITSLTSTPQLIERVVPIDQNFDSGYAGIFRFWFWQFGTWKEILCDDRIPSYRGKPIGIQPAEELLLDFWPCLLEKAYAKLYGGYDRLIDGSVGRSLQDLTGGIVQSFNLSEQGRYLTYQVLNSAVPRSTLIFTSMLPERDRRVLKLRHGLITRSAYEITGLARVRDTGVGNATIGETPLVRLRGPWGRGAWIGSWSEKSIEWESLPETDKEILSVRARTDGEFWMSFLDFVRNFTHLELVHVGPDDWLMEPTLQPRKPWRAVLAKRRWRKGYNAGGGPEYPDTTATNPQFIVQIPRGTNIKCHVVVAITQQYYHQSNTKSKDSFFPIGFAIYEARPNVNRLTTSFVTDNKPLDVTQHSISREVATFFALPPGEYVIVPQTKSPNCETRFLLRILTDEQSSIWEVNDDNLLYRNFTLDYFDTNLNSNESRQLLSRWSTKFPSEIDAAQFKKLLKHAWRSWMWSKPSLETCKTIIMLRDSNISGRLCMKDLPPLLNILLFWKAAFQKWDRSGKTKRTSSFNYRGLLWDSGVGVSNKVLECLVLRFAPDAILTSEAFIISMLRLHLAHERYRALDTKAKSTPNPLSLEEMILMTIYS